jgi:hypothetical protein
MGPKFHTKPGIWVIVGEFNHAPGHVLLVEFGTWNFHGMTHIGGLELLDEHPDDVVIVTDKEDE